jgi:hypothetical protein
VSGAALLLALSLGALPQGLATWRMELAGQPVGLVTLELRPAGAGSAVRWRSRQRLPAEAGGGLLERSAALEVDSEGRVVGPVRLVEGGAARQLALPSGAIPALLLEPLLSAKLRQAAEAPEACLDAFEEWSGAPLRGCARREGGWMRVDLGAEHEMVKPGADGLADEVLLPAQRIRFVRDPKARLPEAPPRLFGVEVEGPAHPEAGARFCGVGRNRAAPGLPAGLPEPRGDGASCREITAGWLEVARAGGWRARTAVGVAWSGAAWSWHAWAEVLVDGGWVAVDPTFHQAPASADRFTLATWEAGDEPARAEAGRRILGCWGRGRVEP